MTSKAGGQSPPLRKDLFSIAQLARPAICYSLLGNNLPRRGRCGDRIPHRERATSEQPRSSRPDDGVAHPILWPRTCQITARMRDPATRGMGASSVSGGAGGCDVWSFGVRRGPAARGGSHQLGRDQHLGRAGAAGSGGQRRRAGHGSGNQVPQPRERLDYGHPVLQIRRQHRPPCCDVVDRGGQGTGERGVHR